MEVLKSASKLRRAIMHLRIHGRHRIALSANSLMQRGMTAKNVHLARLIQQLGSNAGGAHFTQTQMSLARLVS